MEKSDPFPFGSSHLPAPGSSSPSSSSSFPAAIRFSTWSPLQSRTARQHPRIWRALVAFVVLATLYRLSRPPGFHHDDPRFDSSPVTTRTKAWVWSETRPKATTGADGDSFTSYLDFHFPRSHDVHLWITLADRDFVGTGAANLEEFVRQLNRERRHAHRGGKRQAKETRLVTLCLDDACVEECGERGMYCYGGFERRRPEQILRATWPKLASLIETLPMRDVLFVDADVAVKQDPYPHMEPLMNEFDILAQENNAFEHFNTGWIWMKRGQAVADAWNRVLEMDMENTSRDQYNFNTVLGTTQLRINRDLDDPYERPLPADFVASNGLRVHVLDQRLFRIEHVMQNDPVFERHDSLIHHMTCADDKWVKLYIAKARGYWSDLDGYYTSPPPLLSIGHLAATEADATQLFKLLLAVAHYTGRAVVPPSFVTITDLADSPFLARHAPSTFPLSHLERALGISVVEPHYVQHAQTHLAGRSVLDPRTVREDPLCMGMPRHERKRRQDLTVALASASEIDFRKYETFSALVERLLKPDLVYSPHVTLVNLDRDENPSWRSFDFTSLPVGKVRACERLEDPWRCDEFCRGVDELKQGPLDVSWPPFNEIPF
ncbi:hypothetical protein JCM10212_002737 [Sporobolomyces blumeae]